MLILINDNVSLLPWPQALNEVSEQRRQQALQYRFERDQRLAVAVCRLLQLGLERRYGITEKPHFGYSANGKPYLIDHPQIHFNFSHSENVAVCALAETPIGIDVERIKPIDKDTVKAALSNTELQDVYSSDKPAERFIWWWTRKEAVLKMLGCGIGNNNIQTILENCNCTLTTQFLANHQYLMSIARANEE